MSPERNALDGVVELWLQSLDPLRAASRSDADFKLFLAGMGWEAQVIDIAALGAAVTAIQDAIENLSGELALESLKDLADTLDSFGTVVGALKEFSASCAAAAGEPGASADVLSKLAGDVLSHLVLIWVGRQSPAAYTALEILGIIQERVSVAVATAGPEPLLVRVATNRPVLAFDALSSLLRDPVKYLKTRLGVKTLDSETTAFIVNDKLFGALRELVLMLGGWGAVGIEGRDPAHLSATERIGARSSTLSLPIPLSQETGILATASAAVSTELVPQGSISLSNEAGPGVLFTPAGSISAETTVPRGEIKFEVTAGVTSVFFSPSGPPVVHGTDAGVHVLLTFDLLPLHEGDPAIALGSDTAALIVTGLHAAAESRFGRAADPRLDIEISAVVQQARFRLSPAEGDGFLAKVLPKEGLVFGFELGIGWSSRRGVHFSGAASLEADFPIHVSLLGVLGIDAVHLFLGADDAGVGVSVAASATLKLGPVSATVQHLGLRANATFPSAGGNLGPLDVRPELLPPRGVGLSINAQVVKGGGFISNDPANGRYAGILELKIGDILTVTAIGLISTRLPDGSEGFSLLVILTATFPPIQLGFGFTLSGLGGLLGLNRTMNIQALRDGVRSGVLGSILFPADPVGRAVKVISDVESVFPVAAGRFTIGFMARLGWGSPQFLTADLGIILELPMPLRVAIIGRLGIVLPDKEAAVVVLKLDVVGILDLGRQEISIDATLYDSRVAVFEISGDMAVRIGWGDHPVFAVSVGGFNPRFVPPPGFPQLRRLTIALATSKNPRIGLRSYFAITSNTLQVGARLDAHAHADFGFVGTFSVDAYLGFDALIVIRPFQFIVDLSGGITIKRNGSPFLGAELVLTLYGPQPMRAIGYAEVHFLGTHRIPFKVTVGSPAPEASIAPVDPLEELRAVLARAESWSALPPTTAPGVSVVAEDSDALLAHPMGSLTVRQRVVPLGIDIERFGGVPLEGGPRNYSVTYTVGAVQARATSELRDAWAPGDLFNLSDEDKVSLPSFQQLISGHTQIANPATGFGQPRFGAAEEYETRVIDEEDRLPRRVTSYLVPARIQAVLGAVAAAGLVTGSGYSGPQMAVALSDHSYLAASTEDLTATGPLRPSWVEASQRDAGSPGSQIVTSYEVKP